MGKSFTMEIFDSWQELFEDVAGSFLSENLRLVYNSKQLAILCNFHNIVKYSSNLSVDCTVYASDIKIYDLNNVSVFGLKANLDLIKKDGEGFFLIAPF